MRYYILSASFMAAVGTSFILDTASPAIAQQPSVQIAKPEADAQQVVAQPIIVNRPYDGLTAGAEAYLHAESQRRQNISRQLGHVEQLTWSLGLPNRTDGVVWYRDPPSLESWYAYGRPAGAGYIRRPVIAATDVFEPWPRVPDDIFGYPDPAPIRQPIGHVSTQTGPNRWEYHPIYAEDLAPSPSVALVKPAQLSPAVALPSSAEHPNARVVPPPPVPAQDKVIAAGPRAF